MTNQHITESYKFAADKAWKPAPLSREERMRILASQAILGDHELTQSEVCELAETVLENLDRFPGI